ncbi:PQQ-like beta-propeller repeat protein [Flammeovirga aprica]|uniref:PQQ-like beta-propeller repeat protein n=1 Tax=Flammeovirga aprica JL-4 TaxID=694437 RepID=A0A7X9RYM8_9BACT|nr:PQQ-like beta-propeller repeat protein [Flammeovirga aprica]NME71089.1 PQQ-like beta-propeller repeat protein [Flammeovirga aprica JL-4]
MHTLGDNNEEFSDSTKRNERTMNYLYKLLFFSFIFMGVVIETNAKSIKSIETGYTITLVRASVISGQKHIVANSYEGTILLYAYDGKKKWENKLSGFTNHDVWCGDLNNDGNDEILTANADGYLYCLDRKGKLKWKFRSGETPLISVTVLNGKKGKFIATGGMDKNVYYLSIEGEKLETISAYDYSVQKGWGKNGKRYPKEHVHTTNFLRKAQYGNEEILIHAGAINQNSTSGALYFFRANETKPFKSLILKSKSPIGDLKVEDIDGDGYDEIYMGSSGMIKNSFVQKVDLKDFSKTIFHFKDNKKTRKSGNGYRVPQTVSIGEGKEKKLLTLFGERVLLYDTSLTGEEVEVIVGHYSFNDFWKEEHSLLLASAQSGGSCIHILQLNDQSWKKDFANLVPEGKIQKILDNTAEFRKAIQSFEPSKWDGKGEDVYFLTEKVNEGNAQVIRKIKQTDASPYFFNSKHLPHVENWDRSDFGNDFYEKRRDQRKKYTKTQQQMLDQILPLYNDAKGIAYWGGHGNDPMMISLDTEKKIIDAGGKEKKTVMIFPELEHYTPDFEYTLNHFLYPLAEYSQGRNANIYVRTKHTFWQGIIYLKMWDKLLSGEYADVFVPSMEETTDKMMDLSVAGKLGIWTSGATNSWGIRGARDNASYFRLRQHSHQMLPNHFLRNLVYAIASGAQYVNNYAVDQEYISLLYEMIEKGVLYVPKKSQLVSINPVHLSMKEPDKDYLDEGNNLKWTTFYDEEYEKANPKVFSRMNGTWPAAPVKSYDFSTYASGNKERRIDFMPKYHNGVVLITPVQEGKFADKNAPRGKLEEHLHPMYKGQLQEFITDGKSYLSSDGKKTYSADSEYYKQIENAIKEGVKSLPVRIESGEVAWVAVQTSASHIRLTLIDNGYINPDDRIAKVILQKEVKEIKDIVTNQTLKSNGKTLEVNVPCGLFRFIDITLEEEL